MPLRALRLPPLEVRGKTNLPSGTEAAPRATRAGNGTAGWPSVLAAGCCLLGHRALRGAVF
jgi:hypothetical protein